MLYVTKVFIPENALNIKVNLQNSLRNTLCPFIVVSQEIEFGSSYNFNVFVFIEILIKSEKLNLKLCTYTI